MKKDNTPSPLSQLAGLGLCKEAGTPHCTRCWLSNCPLSIPYQFKLKRQIDVTPQETPIISEPITEPINLDGWKVED